jgi:hypothetical protein
MRHKTPVVLVVLFGALVSAGVAGATHTDGSGGPNDFVVGTGQINAGPIDVFLHVNAMNGPNGPQGHVVFDALPPAVPFPLSFHARITCLFVAGNSATVGIEITNSKEGPLPEGFGGLFSFVDSGEPGVADRFEGFPVPVPPTLCPPPFAIRTVTSGNFVVHDATP